MKNLRCFAYVAFLLGSFTGIHASASSSTRELFKLEPLCSPDDFLELQHNKAPLLLNELSEPSPNTLNLSHKKNVQEKEKRDSDTKKRAEWENFRTKFSEEYGKEVNIREEISRNSPNNRDLLAFFDEKFPNLSLQIAIDTFTKDPIPAIIHDNNPQIQQKGDSYQFHQIRLINSTFYLLKSVPCLRRSNAKNFIFTEAKAGYHIRFSFYQQVLEKLKKNETPEQIANDLEFFNHIACPFTLLADKQASVMLQSRSLEICIASRFIENGHPLSLNLEIPCGSADDENSSENENSEAISAQEMEYLKQILEMMNKAGMSHNDLHAGNIIVPGCILIDFNQVTFSNDWIQYDELKNDLSSPNSLPSSLEKINLDSLLQM